MLPLYCVIIIARSLGNFPCYRTNQINYFSKGTILFFWKMEFKTNPGDSPWTLHISMLPTGPTLPMDIPHDSTLPMGLIFPMGRTLPMVPNTYCKQNHQHGLLSSPSWWCLYLSTREWWICFVIGHTWDCNAQPRQVQTKARPASCAVEGKEHTVCWDFNPAPKQQRPNQESRTIRTPCTDLWPLHSHA